MRLPLYDKIADAQTQRAMALNTGNNIANLVGKVYAANPYQVIDMNFYDSSINAARGGFLTPGVRDNLYRGNSELRLANPGFNWNQIGSGLNMFGNEFLTRV